MKSMRASDLAVKRSPLISTWYSGFILLALMGTFAIFAGSMLATIGSRDIAKAVEIRITDKNGNAVPSAQAYARLARSRNMTLIIKNASHPEQWSIGKVFIEGLFIGADRSKFDTIATVTVHIGNSTHTYTKAELIATWTEYDPAPLMPYIPDTYKQSYTLLKAPDEASLPKSHLPFKQEFFARVINWGGDYAVLVEPLARKVDTVIIFILSLFLVQYTIRRYEKRNA